MANVVADFEWEQCFSVDGTWSADEDSIYTTLTYGSESESTSTAYTVSGNTLTILDEGETHIYTRLTEMVDCSDYGFAPADSWVGTFNATVDGTSMPFNNEIIVGEEDGILGIIGYSGVSSLAFALDGGAAGTYSGANAAITYVPDLSQASVMYLANENVVGTTLILNLTTSTATQLVGSFSFTAANIIDSQQMVDVTGQFNLTKN